MVRETHKSKKNRTKSLVVGGAGFVGSHLCEALIAQDQDVVCLDDLATGTTGNISTLQKSSHFTFVEADVNTFDFNSLGPVEYIYHLAALDAYLTEIKPSLETLVTNSIGTKNVLDYAVSCSAKFLYASTIDIYAGVASSLSLRFYYGRTEQDESRFSHHEAKRFGEALTMEYQNKYQLNARIVRLTDVYGPRMPLESADVLNAIFTQVFSSTKIILPNDGLQILHPTYISDVIYGIQRAALLENTNGSIYYLANPLEIEAKDVADQCLRLLNKTSKIEYQKSEELLFPPAKIEIEKSKEELRWEPKVSLEEGIQFTADYFNNRQNNDNKDNDTISVKKLNAPSQPVPEDLVSDAALSAAKPHENPLSIFLKNLRLPKKSGSSGISKETAAPVKKTPEILKPEIADTESAAKKPYSDAGKMPAAGKYIKLLLVAGSLVLVLAGVVGPLLLGGLFTYQGVKQLETAKSQFMELKFSDARQSLLNADRSLTVAYTNIDNLTWISTLFHLRGYSQDVLYLLSGGKDLSAALSSVSNGVEPLLTSMKQTLSDKPQGTYDFQKISREATVEYSLAQDKLAEAQALIDKVNAAHYPHPLSDKITQVDEEIIFVRQSLESATVVNRMLPTIVGQNEDKVYLVLFENNMERRATGGFIGSYARISLKKGKIAEIKVDDIYNPDGQIKGQFAPPDPLKKYLGVTDFGMRDANWSPDFQITAAEEAKLYEAATKEKVDGIFSLDLYFVQDLLRVLGPVALTSRKETITAENLFQKTEYYAEVNYTEGSSNKKDFLGDLGFQILGQIRSLPTAQWSGLVKTLKTGLDQKHVLFYFAEPALQTLALQQNWAGTLQQTNGDYLWIVDSNVGANKSNYFVTRNASYEITSDRDGGLSGKLTLTYAHSGTSDTWPDGTYKDYLRIYVPKNSLLTGSENFKDAPVMSEEMGLTVFSGYFELPIKSTKTITVKYNLPASLGLSNTKYHYELLSQKQSGSRDEPLKLILSWPQYLGITSITQPAVVSGQTATVKTDFNVDRQFTVNFHKK